MNSGIISSRYAEALLRYVGETGGGERVCTQVQQLFSHPEKTPEQLEPELVRFIALLVKNGRMQDVKFIFHDFIVLYYRSLGIQTARLITAVPSPGLVDKLSAILKDRFDCRVVMAVKVDPDIIGGFVLELGDYMLDASVKNQIETIRRQFIIKNKRIV